MFCPVVDSTGANNLVLTAAIDLPRVDVKPETGGFIPREEQLTGSVYLTDPRTPPGVVVTPHTSCQNLHISVV